MPNGWNETPCKGPNALPLNCSNFLRPTFLQDAIWLSISNLNSILTLFVPDDLNFFLKKNTHIVVNHCPCDQFPKLKSSATLTVWRPWRPKFPVVCPLKSWLRLSRLFGRQTWNNLWKRGTRKERRAGKGERRRGGERGWGPSLFRFGSKWQHTFLRQSSWHDLSWIRGKSVNLGRFQCMEMVWVVKKLVMFL